MVIFAVDLYGGGRIDILHCHDEHEDSAIKALAWRSDSQRLYSGSACGRVVELIRSLPQRSDSSSSSSLWTSLVPTKPIRILCECGMPINQLACSVLDNSSVPIDLLIVCSGPQSFLFPMPRNTSESVGREVQGEYEMRECGSRNIVCGACFSTTIFTDDRGKSSKLAHSILLSRAGSASAARYASFIIIK